MLVKTKYFGEIELDDDKILTFEEGLIGFESLKKFALIYSNDEKKESSIMWLQSLDEPVMALPLISPFFVKPDYKPVIEDEILRSLGCESDGTTPIVFVTLTVPSDIKMMSINLKAPIIINDETKKGCQMILENSDYAVKYGIYDVIQNMKKGE